MTSKSQTTATATFFNRNVSRKHFRKQPFPMRSPNSSGDGFVYRINVYEIYTKYPRLLLNSGLTNIPSIDSLKKLIKDIDQLPIDHQSIDYKNPRINWNRTNPMEISKEAGYNLLHEKEKALCSKLRLTPSNYLKAKYNILKSAQKFKGKGKVFKINAQKCGITFNVNKACVLWEFFNQLKWF